VVTPRVRLDARAARSLSFYAIAAGAIAVIGILPAFNSKSDDRESRTVEEPLNEKGFYLAASTSLRDQLGAPDGTAPRVDLNSIGQARAHTRPLTGDGFTSSCLPMLIGASSARQCLYQIRSVLRSSRLRSASRPDYIDNFVRQTLGALSFGEVVARLRSVGFGFEEIRPGHEVLDHPPGRNAGKVLTVPFDGHDLLRADFPDRQWVGTWGSRRITATHRRAHSRDPTVPALRHHGLQSTP
jgi:hypothetical protein